MADYINELREPGDSGGVPQGLDEERSRRRRLTDRARNMLVHLGTLVKQLRVHGPENQAVRKHVDQLRDDLERVGRDEEALSIVFADGHTFVNGVWVRATRRVWDFAVLLSETMERMGSRGVVVDCNIEPESLVQLSMRLRDRLDDPTIDEDGYKEFQFGGLKLLPVGSDADKIRSGSAERREEAASVLKEGSLCLAPWEVVKLDLFMRRRQRALVQRLIGMAEESTEDLLALTAIRDPTLPPGIHSLMVAIYSVALGRLVGFGRRDLVRLGVSALNHNLGEALLPSEVFVPDRELTESERKIVEQHPLVGVRHALRHYGISVPIVERALASAEHHIAWDGRGGYPVSTGTPTHVFSRIIAVADVFNALLSDRPHRAGYPPAQAVKLLLRQTGDHLDPVLSRALVRLVGRFPPGSLVELDTGEWAIVIGPGRGAYPMRRPRALIVTDEHGFELPSFYAIDLGERHPRRRARLRTIVRTRDPRRLGRRVAAYLFAERIEVEPNRLDIEEMREKSSEHSGQLGMQPGVSLPPQAADARSAAAYQSGSGPNVAPQNDARHSTNPFNNNAPAHSGARRGVFGDEPSGAPHG